MKTGRIVVLVLVVALLGAGAVFAFQRDGDGADAERAYDQPNVLIIITDDQRDGTLGWMPATERLFRGGGLAFENAYATTPVCCPARASIMSGQYVHNNGVKYFTPYELDQSSTLQRYLSDEGYRNAYFGKYLNAWQLKDDPPHFDRWAIFPQANINTYDGGEWNVDGRIRVPQTYSTTYIADHARRFLAEQEERDDDQPWLMYLSTPAAHEPFVVEDRYKKEDLDRWRGNPAVFDKLLDKPPYVAARTHKGCDLTCGRRIRVGQYRTLRSVDDMVAGVYEELRRLDEDGRTLAFFISDNGAFWGEFGLSGKRYPYHKSVRVPLLMRWPDRIENATDDRLVSNVDIAPTVFDAAGVEPAPEAPVDGLSLLSDEDRKYMLLEHWPSDGVPGWISIATTKFQYIENYRGDNTFFREYYDLRKDPWQKNNVLEDVYSSTKVPSKRLRKLERLVERFRDCVGDDCP